MEQEQMELLSKKFKEAYDWRADKEDIDWKDTGRVKLAYLNWAVAWRKMKEIYPDANYRLVETPEGLPLWNVNGFGMLKCAISAMGIEYVETFPIMDNRNEAVKIENIDARDVNDSMQRGLTKAIARFGIGLYIYEGKLEAPKDEKKPYVQSAQTQYKGYAPQGKFYTPNKPTEKQLSYLHSLLEKKNMTAEQLMKITGSDPTATATNAKKAIDALLSMNQAYEPPTLQEKGESKEEGGEPFLDDELPF